MARGTRIMATGLAIASGIGMAGEVPPALANMGGMPATGPATPAAKISYILRHEASGTNFRAVTLDAPDEGGVIEATVANGSDESGMAAEKQGLEVDGPIVDPVVITSTDGQSPVLYAGRKGEASLGTIPAANAELVEYVAGLAIPITDPEALFASHTLHDTPGVGLGAVGFTAENGDAYATLP